MCLPTRGRVTSGRLMLSYVRARDFHFHKLGTTGLHETDRSWGNFLSHEEVVHTMFLSCEKQEPKLIVAFKYTLSWLNNWYHLNENSMHRWFRLMFYLHCIEISMQCVKKKYQHIIWCKRKSWTPGFAAWNIAVGSKTNGLCTLYFTNWDASGCALYVMFHDSTLKRSKMAENSRISGTVSKHVRPFQFQSCKFARTLVAVKSRNRSRNWPRLVSVVRPTVMEWNEPTYFYCR